MANRLTLVGFDADDTLWHNEQYFQLTQAHFKLLLRDFAEPELLAERLIAAERRNLGFYGYGVKGFTLSMIETAIEVTAGKVPVETIGEILRAGRDIMAQPVELLPGVGDTLDALKGRYRLALITKGDLFDQERKIAQSGLGDFFDAVEIVSEKDAGTYSRIFTRHGTGAPEAMMVGNSLKSDVIPALEAGSWGVFVPHEHQWEMERADEPEGHARYLRANAISEVEGLVSEIGAE